MKYILYITVVSLGLILGKSAFAADEPKKTNEAPANAPKVEAKPAVAKDEIKPAAKMEPVKAEAAKSEPPKSETGKTEAVKTAVSPADTPNKEVKAEAKPTEKKVEPAAEAKKEEPKPEGEKKAAAEDPRKPASVTAPVIKHNFEIRAYRYRKHSKDDYERLVLEFKTAKSETPVVKLSGQNGEADVVLENTAFLGAIPEAAINEIFQARSQYLGSLIIDTENTKGVGLKVKLKDPKANVHAFWLQNPDRLVVDAFPPTSARAASLKPRETATASLEGKAAPKEEATEVKEEKTVKQAPPLLMQNEGRPDEEYFGLVDFKKEEVNLNSKKWRKIRTEVFDQLWDVQCYHLRSAVAPAVSFGIKNSKTFEEVPAYPEIPKVEDPDSVICFPKTAQLTPLVIFRSQPEDLATAPKPQSPPQRGLASLPEPVVSTAPVNAGPAAQAPVTPTAPTQMAPQMAQQPPMFQPQAAYPQPGVVPQIGQSVYPQNPGAPMYVPQQAPVAPAPQAYPQQPMPQAQLPYQQPPAQNYAPQAAPYPPQYPAQPMVPPPQRAPAGYNPQPAFGPTSAAPPPPNYVASGPPMAVPQTIEPVSTQAAPQRQLSSLTGGDQRGNFPMLAMPAPGGALVPTLASAPNAAGASPQSTFAAIPSPKSDVEVPTPKQATVPSAKSASDPEEKPKKVEAPPKVLPPPPPVVLVKKEDPFKRPDPGVPKPTKQPRSWKFLPRLF